MSPAKVDEFNVKHEYLRSQTSKCFSLSSEDASSGFHFQHRKYVMGKPCLVVLQDWRGGQLYGGSSGSCCCCCCFFFFLLWLSALASSSNCSSSKSSFIIIILLLPGPVVKASQAYWRHSVGQCLGRKFCGCTLSLHSIDWRILDSVLMGSHSLMERKRA